MNAGRWLLILSSLMVSVWACSEYRATAQIVPDNTLPVGERSQVSGNPLIQINGGATRGSNLFHSFQQFSLPTGSTAFFNNAPTIQNIFTRVTGGSISNIDGIIKANGTANLFLLNPNGILFGANARLNIGGSFVATTASGINFADGTLFSARANQTTPLLTVSVPIGLQLGQNPGNISVQGTGYDLSVSMPVLSPITRGSSLAGLRVSSGKTLALVGGDIDVENGTLTAEQGRIELGSVDSGQASLSPILEGFALSYQGIQSFGDIRLSGSALVDASGSPGGSIQVQGNQVLVADGSILLIQNQGEQRAGSISVNAASSLELRGTDPEARFPGRLDTETLGGGSSADIAISTPQLIVRDGADILSGSYSSGKAGNITVSASDLVQIIGASPINPSYNSGIASGAYYSSGDTGNITVSTRRLTLESGGGIGTQNLGSGKGGDVTVNAVASVELSGVGLVKQSNIFALGIGDGNAGNVTLNTSRLVVRDGGVISAPTYKTANAGNVIINATESVEISGVAQLLIPVPSEISASSYIYPGIGQSILPSGNSGNVTVTTRRLSVNDGALINVSNKGTGDAGTLQVTAELIDLDRGGAITAATSSGEGGNINLQVQDVLLMRHHSQITTSAGGTGNGGNIGIDSSLLVAIPNEDSDISANSVNSRGGNVTINTDGLFGIQLREQATSASDITATGANSALNGTVQVNIQRVDPSQGLVELPTTVVDTSRLIAQGCPANRRNSFVVTGRGGLPPTPQQALSNDPLWQDWRTPAVANRQPNTSPGAIVPADNLSTTRPKASAALVEATGWEMNPNGKVVLTATAPRENLYPPMNCNRS